MATKKTTPTNQNGSEPVEKEIEMIAIELLHFDPENPRLPSTLHRTDESEVLKWMLDKATLAELMGSIGAQNYFAGEPIMVVRRPGGGFFVIEGNRRLAAVKLLKNPSLAPIRKNEIRSASEGAVFRPSTLPAIVFETREEIMDNLGFRHVTGIKPWPSLAKARFLSQLLSQLPVEMPTEQKTKILAQSLGSNRSTVKRLLIGYEVYVYIDDKDYFRIKGLGEDNLDFSLLTTALNYTNIADFVGLEDTTFLDISKIKSEELEEITKWIFQKDSEGRTRIGESRRLGDLAQVVEKPEALEAFRKGRPLQDAVLLTGLPTENFREALAIARARLEDAQSAFNSSTLDLSQSDVNELESLRKMANSLRISVKAQLDGDEE